MTSRRAIAYALVVGTIIKHWITGDYGPLDRLVELGVFLLIAYEVGLTVRHQWQNRKRAKIVAVLSDFMFEGQTIARAVPNPDLPKNKYDYSTISEWIKSVQVWRTDVAQSLSAYSSRVASAFLLITDAHNTDNVIQPLEGWSFHVTGGEREAYQTLLSHLDNLRRIIEKPEVYF